MAGWRTSTKSLRRKDGQDEPPAPGRNGERNFRGEKRSNETRALVSKFRAWHRGRFPTWQQATGYSSVLHWAKAVVATGTDDGLKIGPALRPT